jgi:hypothetical protein
VNETDELLYQLGLLLTQTRFARRTLEDIERETATYGTFAFTSVIAAGSRFGQPPLFDGALRVHIVNINDLAPGSGFGSLIEGILGGAGRFASNLLGGFVSGLISTPWLLAALPIIDRIAQSIERIFKLIGVGAPPPIAAKDPKKGADGKPVDAKAADAKPAKPGDRGEPVGGSTLLEKIDLIKRAINGLTGLFTASASGGDAGAKASTLPSTAEGRNWQKFLETTTTMLGAVGNVAGGLAFLIPTAVGAIASLIYRLADIRVSIAETLQFFLRNVLMLRGVLFVTVFDALALIARLAATAVELLAETLSKMLSPVFDTVRESLLAVLMFAGALGDGIKNTIDQLLNWLVPTINKVLNAFGDTRAFRVVTHLVQILPAILPPIFELAKSTPLDPTVQKSLKDVATPIAGLYSTSGPGPKPDEKVAPPAPSPSSLLADAAVAQTIKDSVNRLKEVAVEGPKAVGKEGAEGLKTLATRFSAAAAAETKASDKELGKHLDAVKDTSKTLAENVIVPEKITPNTGLEAIAKAYETWLTTGNGLTTLLGTITRHFKSSEGQTGIPQRVVEGSASGSQTTIQIDEVVIELDPAPPGTAVPPSPPSEPRAEGFPEPRKGDDIECHARMWRDYRMRGGSSELLPALA